MRRGQYQIRRKPTVMLARLRRSQRKSKWPLLIGT